MVRLLSESDLDPSAETRKLLPRQKDDVFRRIQEAGFDPSGFSWCWVHGKFGNRLVEALSHSGGTYYFIFDGHSGDDNFGGERIFRSVWCPAGDHPVDSKKTQNWAGQLECVREWLIQLEHQLGSPNLWARIASETALDGAAAAEQNTPFTSEEVVRLGERLVKIENHLVHLAQLQAEDREAVHARLDYLAEAANRVGRKDFVLLAIGVLMNIVVSVGLPSETAREWMAFAADQLVQGVGFVVGPAKQWLLGN